MTIRRWRPFAALALVATFGLAACTSGGGGGGGSTSTSPSASSSASSSGGATGSPTSGSCPLAAKAVPTCGALWGVATQPPTVAGVEAIEQKVGRTFDIVYRYHDLKGTIPDAEEKQLVQRGTLLHVAIASRLFSGGSIPYADVAAGKYDDVLRQDAQGIKSLGAPVYVTFEQEANQKDKAGGEGRGGAQDFVAAWRHVHQVFADAGADNAVWVWVMTGNAQNLPRTAALWPGNEYVDWISWNIYNQSGCRSGEPTVAKYQSFEEGVATFYDWVTSAGRAAGIDASKPMMISEAGTAQYPDDPQKSAQWYADIPAALQKYPQVKAVTLWASGGGGPNNCSYRFQDNPTITSGVADAAKGFAAIAAKPSS